MTYKGDEGTRRGVGTTDDGLLYELLREVARHPGTGRERARGERRDGLA
jgi:hypothetical protein